MPLLTASPTSEPIHDQARELRRMIANRSNAPLALAAQAAHKGRSITVFSGKGGVGKSVVALNLGIALARRGAAVCLLDATPHVGNLGLSCGQNGYWNLSHVVAGTRSLDDILMSGPNGIRILPGGIHLLHKSPPRDGLRQALNELERRYDWLIVDTSADVLHFARQFVESADCALCVTTPEPTAIAAAYAGLKSLAAEGKSTVSILVNQATVEQQADEIGSRLRQAVRSFLASDTGLAGFVPVDEAVRQSVFRREPLSLVDPPCPALRAFDQVAGRIDRTVFRRFEKGYFEQIISSPRRHEVGSRT